MISEDLVRVYLGFSFDSPILVLIFELSIKNKHTSASAMRTLFFENYCSINLLGFTFF
jgi:hypothetical protein